MDFEDIKEKIGAIRNKLEELKDLSSVVETENWLEKIENGEFSARTNLSDINEDLDNRLSELKEEIEAILPPGYRVGGNLLRHLHWLQVTDLFDIYKKDTDDELTNLKQFEDRLVLVDYLTGLHPKVAKVKSLVLEGSYDEALKAVFTSLEARIRTITGDGPRTGIKASIATAFNADVLKHSKDEYNEPARDYLIGVLTYFRSQIAHQDLPRNRDSVQASLSLFAVAHEAFMLIERCHEED